MIRDLEYWEEFERELERNTPVDIAENFRLYEAMYEEARMLGIFPLKNPLEGIEDDIRLARILNSVHKAS